MANVTSKTVKSAIRFDQSGNYTAIDAPNGLPVTSKFSTSAMFDTSFNSSGYQNPGWKDQVRNYLNATTSFTATGVEFEPIDSLSSLWFNRQAVHKATKELIYNHSGYTLGHLTITDVPVNSLVPNSTVTRVDNRCIAKFLDAIESAQSSIEAGQDIGEYKETLHSIHRPLSSLRDGMVNYLSQLRKLKKSSKNRANLKKILSDTYLEFHFGWQPLADDVAQIIADCGRFRFPVIPVYASAHDRFSGTSSVVTRSATPLPDNFTFPTRSTHEYSVRRKGAVRSNSAMDGRISWAQSLRLTPENWLPTAWDLLPYSWIADYFTNIGDILQGLAHIHTNLVWGARMEKNVCYFDVFDAIYKPLPDQNAFNIVTVDNCGSAGGRWQARRYTYNRTTIGEGDLVPRFEFRIPTGKYPFLNMGALLLQRSKGLVPFFREAKSLARDIRAGNLNHTD